MTARPSEQNHRPQVRLAEQSKLSLRMYTLHNHHRTMADNSGDWSLSLVPDMQEPHWSGMKVFVIL